MGMDAEGENVRLDKAKTLVALVPTLLSEVGEVIVLESRLLE